MEDIICHHEEEADIKFHDGALRHVIGACNYQVVRSAKDIDQSPEGRGFTYNHAPMLAYWNHHFFYEYLSGPKGEHESPSAAFLCISKDGIQWDRPVEIFPPKTIKSKFYCGPQKEDIKTERIPLVVHHRMGFHTSKNGRFLVSTFYGISPDPHVAPNNGYGVGRVVREIYKDFTMSDIYIIRYNEAGGYGKAEVDIFDDYNNSKDSGFIEACKELLQDILVTKQWWEEERLDSSFFTNQNGKALSYYTLNDGSIMGVFKESLTSVSKDCGKSWSSIKKSSTLITSTGKVWGQKMPDGNYALVYNPSYDSAHRWPLAITTGDNGHDFYELAAIVPEISPCRYEGILKNLGAQYMRGIAENNGKPEDMGIWIAYSVNKEDLWITRVPVPVKTIWKGEVHDFMDSISDVQLRNSWNLYVPAWGTATLLEVDGKRSLVLLDSDPYNRLRGERIFESYDKGRIRFEGRIKHLSKEKIAFILQSGNGRNLITLIFDEEQRIFLQGEAIEDQFLSNYVIDRDFSVELLWDSNQNTCEICVDGISRGEFYIRIKGLLKVQPERLVLTTKHSLPFQGLETVGKYGDIGNLIDADIKRETAGLCIHSLEVVPIKEPMVTSLGF